MGAVGGIVAAMGKANTTSGSNDMLAQLPAIALYTAPLPAQLCDMLAAGHSTQVTKKYQKDFWPTTSPYFRKRGGAAR